MWTGFCVRDEPQYMDTCPELVRGCVARLDEAKIVVVKSPNIYVATYALMAARMLLVDSREACTPPLNTQPFHRLDISMILFDCRYQMASFDA